MQSLASSLLTEAQLCRRRRDPLRESDIRVFQEAKFPVGHQGPLSATLGCFHSQPSRPRLKGSIERSCANNAPGSNMQLRPYASIAGFSARINRYIGATIIVGRHHRRWRTTSAKHNLNEAISSRLPLAGVRVLDLTRVLAGVR